MDSQPQTRYALFRRKEPCLGKTGPSCHNAKSSYNSLRSWRTPEAMEHFILALRQDHHDWGGCKIQDVLVKASYEAVPSPSTITDVLRRHGMLDPHDATKHRPFTRFEHAAPNDLWQMDFKGHFPVTQGRCPPLTILDDHPQGGREEDISAPNSSFLRPAGPSALRPPAGFFNNLFKARHLSQGFPTPGVSWR